jgi:hypothetical protein
MNARYIVLIGSVPLLTTHKHAEAVTAIEALAMAAPTVGTALYRSSAGLVEHLISVTDGQWTVHPTSADQNAEVVA